MPDQVTPLAIARGRSAERQDHPLLTVAETARMLRVSEMTVRRACDAGDLPSIRMGRVRRISREYVRQLLDEAAGSTAADVATEHLVGVMP